jgi:predicted lipoprotein with Yx(FWY)xxD motif
MRRILILLAVTVAGAATTVALASASLRRAKLQLHSTAVGKILVNRAGFTVYVFAKDKRNRDVCARISGCLGIWPPVTTSRRPIVGAGVERRLIGTITVPGVGKQLTYDGHPLYTYIGDIRPAQTSYVGVRQFGARWFAINGAGRVVR